MNTVVVLVSLILPLFSIIGVNDAALASSNSQPEFFIKETDRFFFAMYFFVGPDRPVSPLFVSNGSMLDSRESVGFNIVRSLTRQLDLSVTEKESHRMHKTGKNLSPDESIHFFYTYKPPSFHPTFISRPNVP